MNVPQYRHMRQSLFKWIVLPWILSAVFSAAAHAEPTLRPEDIMAVKDVVDLQLSPDGREVIYTLKEADLKAGRYVQTLWRVSTDGQHPPARLTDSDKDSAAQWSADSKQVFFLSTRDGKPQVWVMSLESGAPQAVTQAASGVSTFRVAPDCKQIAFVAADQAKSAVDQALGNRDTGAVIQKWDFSIYNLLGNQLFLDLSRPSSLWIQDLRSKKLTRVTTDLNVTNFEWSPDSRAVALAAKPAAGLSNQRSDISVYSLGGEKLDTLLRGEGGENWENSKSYSNPLWSPDGKRLAVFYKDWKDHWSALSRVGIYTFAGAGFSLITTGDKLELYNPRIRWVENDQIYLEDTQRARRRLLLLSVQDGSVHAVAVGEGHDSDFSFSADGAQRAFVHQTMEIPPEIYFSHDAATPAQKLTSLNADFAALPSPSSESVHWKAPDGVEVQGWLIKPPGFKTTQHSPLVVLVHGGPGYAIENNFDYYPAWPYPFRILALRGYLVFIPNYRGTATFGKAFREPRDIGQVPADDILAGISSLVNQGIVDTERIGITGQSHGGWLGPYVITRKKIFRVAAFAEGSVDLFSNYAQMPGWLDLNVHEAYFGSPYDNPQRYIELSPIFHFAGLHTPTLMEYGEESLSAAGLELLTAYWRHGIPNEFIIYPKTGHNIASPVLQLESMHRMLDWFEYWMYGKQDPDPAKQPEYDRWKKMTADMEKMRAWTPQTLAH